MKAWLKLCREFFSLLRGRLYRVVLNTELTNTESLFVVLKKM